MTTATRDFRALVLDIEGTTTPISFVYDTLFPYAASAFEDFLRSNHAQGNLSDAFEALARQARSDQEEGLDAPSVDPSDVETALANVRWQMENDRKTTTLKDLQGKIWRDGYERGELKGEVFEDVPRLLEAADKADIPVRIYSSGSVEAQKLLFGYSTAGDLTVYLSGYHDTTTGPKKVASSYTEIASQMGMEPGGLLFATDNLDEAIAAREAGWQVVVMDRPGNHPLPEHDFEIMETFEGVIEAL